MPLYIGDYLRDTLHLTTKQHGAYLLLLFAYWTKGPLLNDDSELASIAKLLANEWQEMRPTIERFFSVEGSFWIHKRVEEELEHATSITTARSKAGRAGGLAARGKSGRPKNSKRNSKTMPNELQNNTPSPSPSHNISNTSLDEVMLLFEKAGGPPEEASKFFNFYSSKGWKVGKNNMRSVPHAVANWMANWRERQNNGTNQKYSGSRVDRNAGTANTKVAGQYEGIGKVV